MKTCTECKQELPFTSFNKSSRHKDGFMNVCRACKAAIMKINADDAKRARAQRVNAFNKARQKPSGSLALPNRSSKMDTTYLPPPDSHRATKDIPSLRNGKRVPYSGIKSLGVSLLRGGVQ